MSKADTREWRLQQTKNGLFVGSSEMHALLRAVDWAATPLGPASTWPQSLKVSIDICLESPLPIVLFWGNDFRLFYNDAFRPILGQAKHPPALGQSGRQVWAEIWESIGPLLEGVRAKGEAVRIEDQFLLINHAGFLQEGYVTITFSPIRDESGGIGGVFGAVNETTQRVLRERRAQTLQALTANTATATTSDEIYRAALAALARNPHDLPFAAIYRCDVRGEAARLIAGIGHPPGTEAIPEVLDLDGSAAGLGHRSLSGAGEAQRPALPKNGVLQPLTLPQEYRPGDPPSAWLLPIQPAGQMEPAGFLLAGLSPRRPFDDDYRSFLEMASRSIATALTNAQADEAGRTLRVANETLEQRVAERTAELRESERKLATELDVIVRLHDLGTQMVNRDIKPFYEQMLDFAIQVMHADYATLQMADDDGDTLRMLAWRGFHPDSARFWQTVRAASASCCAAALRQRTRVVIADVAQSELLGGAELREYRRSGIGSVQSTPLISRSGRLVGMASTYWCRPYAPPAGDLLSLDLLVRQAADLIEQKRAEAALREANEKLESRVAERTAELDIIIESIADAVLVYDAEGTITKTNAAGLALLGKNAGDPLGSIADYLRILQLRLSNGQPIPLHGLAITRALRDGEVVYGREEIGTHPNTGRHIDLYVSTAPLRAATGEVAGAVQVAADITRLHEFQERQREFISLTSHDLRSPLTAILGIGQLLCQGLARKGLAVEARNAETIVKSARRMGGMIQDLVDSTRLESGQLDLHKEPVDLRRLIAELVEQVGTLKDRERLQVDATDPLPLVPADRRYLERAITNLLSNALKYSPSDTIVRISLDRRDGAARIRVSDRGVGIPQEDLPHVFDRYFRSGTAGHREGLGLGLYITRGLIEAHGGRIWVESEVGHGSTFSLALPVA